MVDLAGAACAERIDLVSAAEDGTRADRDAMRALCLTCPVRERCLGDALEAERGKNRDLRLGVWGGMDGGERLRLAQQTQGCQLCGETPIREPQVRSALCRPCGHRLAGIKRSVAA